MFIYTVRPGDDLTQISIRFGVPINRIITDNSLSYPNNLVVGQHLIIMSDMFRYTIKEGQTLFSLSQEFEIPLEALLEANPDVNPIALQIGEVVNIPLPDNTPRRPAVINGYAYPYITDSILNCSLPFLTFLSPFSYSITSDGDIVPLSDTRIIELAKNSSVTPLMVVTNISEGSFSTEVLSQILASPFARERLISSILAELANKGYGGVNLDMEYILPNDKDSYNAFLFELSDRLHSNGYILITAVAPKLRADQPGLLYEAHDYKAQGEAADYVIIMTYEWGYTYGYL